jgi:hypothetical protein
MLYYNPQDPLSGALAVPQGQHTEPISEEAYRELVASSTPEPTPQPNWEQFVGQMLIDPDFNQLLTAALTAAPAAAVGLPTALAQVATHGVSQFEQVYRVVIEAGGASDGIRAVWRGYAQAANLPESFVSII